MIISLRIWAAHLHDSGVSAQRVVRRAAGPKFALTPAPWRLVGKKII